MKWPRYSPDQRARYLARALTHSRQYFTLPYCDARIVSRHKPTGKIKTLTIKVKYGNYPLLKDW